MQQHVKVLGFLHIVFGCLGILAGVATLVILGGIGAVASIADHSHDARLALPILGGIGTFVFLLLSLLSLPGIIAGIGLLQFRPWARILTLILSAFELIHFPFGTALGAYGFWVLLSREGEQLFARPAFQPAIHPRV
jgi:hypothetical protein